MNLTSLRLLALCIALLFSGCQTSYYKTMESFGVYKRDILVDRVVEGKKSQQEAKEQFQTALEKFTELTQFDGGHLQKTYEKLSKELKRSEDRAKEVSKRIDSIEAVSKSLFREWETELKQFRNADYRQISEEQLRDTRTRYQALIEAMKKAEKSIHPVLVTFQDQVLFLKHNLNAQAIASLGTQATTLKTDIQALIEEMEQSIAEADTFIDRMNQG